MQAQLSSSSKELQGRCASTAAQLQDMTRKAEDARTGQATTKQALADANIQVWLCGFVWMPTSRCGCGCGCGRGMPMLRADANMQVWVCGCVGVGVGVDNTV